MEANGFSYIIWKDRAGKAYAHEVDGQGNKIGPLMVGSENAWRFGGQSELSSLAEWIKENVNGKKTWDTSKWSDEQKIKFEEDTRRQGGPPEFDYDHWVD